MEDEEIVQSVQKGVNSAFYNTGRFSPTKEKGVHHFHSLISRFLMRNKPQNNLNFDYHYLNL